MRQNFIFLFIILALNSCQKKTNIEIYLLNNRKEYEGCIPVPDSIKNRMDSFSFSQELIKAARIDTVSDRLISAGEFEATKTDMQPLPFISDNEIVKFNDGELILTPEAAEKVVALYPKNSVGRQFVITVKGKPELTGYFWNAFSSSRCDWYQISYYRSHKGNKFQIMYSDPRTSNLMIENLPYSKNLKAAFRNPK